MLSVYQKVAIKTQTMQTSLLNAEKVNITSLKTLWSALFWKFYWSKTRCHII